MTTEIYFVLMWESQVREQFLLLSKN